MWYRYIALLLSQNKGVSTVAFSNSCQMCLNRLQWLKTTWCWLLGDAFQVWIIIFLVYFLSHISEAKRLREDVGGLCISCHFPCCGAIFNALYSRSILYTGIFQLCRQSTVVGATNQGRAALVWHLCRHVIVQWFCTYSQIWLIMLHNMHCIQRSIINMWIFCINTFDIYVYMGVFFGCFM